MKVKCKSTVHVLYRAILYLTVSHCTPLYKVLTNTSGTCTVSPCISVSLELIWLFLLFRTHSLFFLLSLILFFSILLLFPFNFSSPKVRETIFFTSGTDSDFSFNFLKKFAIGFVCKFLKLCFVAVVYNAYASGVNPLCTLYHPQFLSIWAIML